MRNASARCFEMKAPFNNNLPIQTDDVMVNPKNPVNPDSKLVAASTKMQPCQEKSKRSHPVITTFLPNQRRYN